MASLGHGWSPRFIFLGLLCLLRLHISRPDEVPAELEAAAAAAARERAAHPPKAEHAEDLKGHPESDIFEEGQVQDDEFEEAEDKEADCGAWADLGECDRNPAYMKDHCAESCYHSHIIRAAVQTGKPFRITCSSTVGPFVMELHPAWAPWGVERFLKLLGDGWFDDSPFFRAIPQFLVQFGASLDWNTQQRWADRPAIPDDSPHGKPLANGFQKGMVAFAGNGVNSRTNQLFVAFSDSDHLGQEPWETPIGVVVEGMEKLESMAMYGDFPSFGGSGPDPQQLNGPVAKEYLQAHFRDMDYITYCVGDLPVDKHGDEVGDSPDL